MIGGVQPKVLVKLTEGGELLMDEDFLKVFSEMNWRLVRERDGLTKESKEVMWIEWNEEGRFKSKHDEPAVDRSLVMSPFTMSFTWQTTNVTEIIEEREDYIKFKTQNSNYELFKIK